MIERVVWMSRSRCVSCLFCVSAIALLGGCATETHGFAAVREVESRRDDWRFADETGSEIRTKHYAIFTTLREPYLVDALPQAMESAYLFYRQLVPAAAEPTETMPVYLFARRGHFANFTRQTFGARAQLLLKVRGGGYSERGISVIEYVAHQIAFPVVAHEGMHQYLYHCVNKRIPAWLNEGLAVLCEGQRWDNKGLVEFDPYYNPLRRNALADVLLRNRQFSLAHLLKSNAGHVVGGSSTEVDAFYGQVWALMLFLRDGEEGKYRDGLTRMLLALGTEDLEQFAQAAHATSKQEHYEFGQALFAAFISADFDAVGLEFDRFMREKIIAKPD